MTKRLARVLGGALEQADDQDAAIAAAVEATSEGAVTAARDGDAPADEDELRSIADAIGADPDGLVEAARLDGHIFDGDVLPSPGDVLEVHGRLIEAPKTGKKGRHRFIAIRPCEGKGPGARIYTAPVLQAAVESGAFTGLPMFFNHEPISTIIARGHGSRDPRDLAGRTVEATWDPSYTDPEDAKNGYGKGAVLVEADLVPQAAELVKHLPEAVLASINMRPTKLRARRRTDGKIGALVEGFHVGQGSLDLVTAAGAGGRYLERLQEANEGRYAPRDDAPDASNLSDEQLEAAVLARPEVLGRLREAPAPAPEHEHDTEDGVTSISKDALVEALRSPDGQAALSEVIDTAVEAQVEERLDQVRDEARAEAEAESGRRLDLRDMRDEAHRAIEAAHVLTPTGTEELKARYGIRGDGSPAPALDLFDELDAAGGVAKPKMQLLREAVEADIKREEQKLREANPTRVRGLGAPPVTTSTGASGAAAVESDAGGAGGDGKDKINDPVAEALGLDPAAVRSYQEA